MLKITSIVEQILHEDVVALEALTQGWLNLSKYTQSIHHVVEARCLKPVKRTSIVVALSRLAPSLQKPDKTRPTVQLNNLSLKAPLCDLTFEKTHQALETARSLSRYIKTDDRSFFTLTEGVTEVTVIVSQSLAEQVIELFHEQPKSQLDNLVGITVSFPEVYIAEHNVIFALIAHLASRHVNILEIVSTYTELTVLVAETDVELVLASWRPLLATTQ